MSELTQDTGSEQLEEQFGIVAPNNPDIVTTVLKQLCDNNLLWHPYWSKLVEQGVPTDPLVS